MRTAADAMITDVKLSQSDVTVGEVRQLFADEHVHAVLLVDDGTLRAVVVRDDLDGADDDDSAVPLGQLAGRTVAPDDDLDEARAQLEETGGRRLAVIDDAGRLLGLLCLKRSRAGFCTPADLASRRG